MSDNPMTTHQDTRGSTPTGKSSTDNREWTIDNSDRPPADEIGADLTKFQLNILAILADEPRYGLRIKRDLEDYYGTEINHGRLYPNLDDLADRGFIDVGQRDRRTNEYTITEAGERAVRDSLEWILAHYLSDYSTAADDLRTLVDAATPDPGTAGSGGGEGS